MKYAVATVMDQTFGYLTSEGDFTIHHPEVLLFDTREEAEAAVKKCDSEIPYHYHNGEVMPEEVRFRQTSWVDEVQDETEFRARPDTW